MKNEALFIADPKRENGEFAETYGEFGQEWGEKYKNDREALPSLYDVVQSLA